MVKDANGAPLAVYHATDNMDFVTFEKGDIGFHFGSKSQAVQRSKDRGYSQGRIFRAYLNIKNPVVARIGIMSWSPRGTMFLITDVRFDENGTPTLFMTEVTDGETGVDRRGIQGDVAGNSGIQSEASAEGYGGKMQFVQAQNPNVGDLQAVSQNDPQADTVKQGGLPGVQSDRGQTHTESVGAAPSGFDPNSHLQYKYGTMPEGENSVRPDDLPVRDMNGNKISLVARTVKGAKVTPDEFVPLLERQAALCFHYY